MKRWITFVAVIAILVCGTVTLLERHTNRQLVRDNAALNARAEQLSNENENLATRLRDAERGSRLGQNNSPTRTQGSGSINSSNMASGKELFARLMRGDPVQLTAEQA